MEFFLFFLFLLMAFILRAVMGIDLSVGYIKKLSKYSPSPDFKKWNIIKISLFVLCVSYLIIYPSIYKHYSNQQKLQTIEIGKKRAMEIKMPSIDPEMQMAIDEKIQNDLDKRIAENAKVFYKRAKEYLESTYRNSNIPIIFFMFDDQYEYYRYTNGEYDIIFNVTISLSNGSFLTKRFYFFMKEDDLNLSDKVRNTLDYKEENI
jgi:hypothetical protein